MAKNGTKTEPIKYEYEDMDIIAPETTAIQPLPNVVGKEVSVVDELEGYSGYEDFDSADLIIPRIKIIQPTSRKGEAGKFMMNLTEEESDTLSLVVIKATRSRVLWSDDLEAEEPICRSQNFVVPDPAIDEPVSLSCAEYAKKGDLKILQTVCDKAKWFGKERPACNQVFNLLCLSDEDVPFWISLSGVSIGPVKRYISTIALRRKKLWQFETVISTEERLKPTRHYAIKFGPPNFLSDERIKTVAELVIAFKSQAAQVTPDEDRAVSDDGGAPF
jgi:hypothetical protein